MIYLRTTENMFLLFNNCATKEMQNIWIQLHQSQLVMAKYLPYISLPAFGRRTRGLCVSTTKLFYYFGKIGLKCSAPTAGGYYLLVCGGPLMLLAVDRQKSTRRILSRIVNFP